MLRPFNPVDLVGLLLLQARAEPNLARGRRALLAGQRRSIPFLPLVTGWFPRQKGCRGWVYARKGIAAGLVSVCRRRGQNCWEVDRLQVPRGQTGRAVDMLEALSIALGRLGAERLFLRVPAGGEMEKAAIGAGLKHLLAEEQYVRPPGAFGPPDTSRLTESARGTCREAGPADVVDAFRLYCSLVPPELRQAEGVTLGSWGAAELADGLPVEASVICEKDGDVLGIAAVSRASRSRMLDLLIRPSAIPAAEGLIDAALERRSGRTTMCLLPSYLASAGPALESRGFRKSDIFSVYGKHIVARVRQPGLVPVGA